MTSDEWLKSATSRLDQAGVGTARLDALVLLEDVTNTNRTQLLAHPDSELTVEQQEQLNSLLIRRAQHIPLAYLRGKTEFYGREFVVSPAVLEPRPESETMIELLKQLDVKAPRIADVGSGSGALGITASLEIPNSDVDLLEIDAEALKISQLNTKKLVSTARCIKSDLLQHAKPRPYDVILANLPYVPDDHQINEAAMNEPHLAIFGGPDGLDLYRRLFDQLPPHTSNNAFVLTEALPFQHEELTNIASAQNFKLVQVEDFIQVFQKI